MKLRTSISLAAILLALCAGAGVYCGRQAYRLSHKSIGSVKLPDDSVESSPLTGQEEADSSSEARSAQLLTEAAILERVNAITDYSSYGAPASGSNPDS